MRHESDDGNRQDDGMVSTARMAMNGHEPMKQNVRYPESDASTHAGRQVESSFPTFHASFQGYTFMDYTTQGYMALVGLINRLLLVGLSRTAVGIRLARSESRMWLPTKPLAPVSNTFMFRKLSGDR